MRRGGEHLARRRGLHHAALFHHHDPVAISGGEAKIVSDQNGGHPPLAGQLGDQVHHRLLRGDVQSGGRFVGDQQSRLARQGDGDDDALAHAAGELERVGGIAFLRAGDAHLAEHLDRGFPCFGRRRLIVPRQHVFDLPSDRADRVQRGARVLEDHRDLPAADVLQLGLGGARQVDAAEADAAARDATGPVQDAQHGIGGDRLAGAGLADDARRAAFLQRQIDMLHRADRAIAGGEFHRQFVHFK